MILNVYDNTIIMIGSLPSKALAGPVCSILEGDVGDERFFQSEGEGRGGK